MSDPAPDGISDPGGRPARSRRPRRIALWGVGAAVVVFGGLYAAGLAVGSDGIPDGTRVRGVDIGGMSHEEAVRTLDARAAKSWAAPIDVRIGDAEDTVRPAAAGLALDAEATVDRAAGRSGAAPFTVIGRLFGGEDGGDVSPVVTTDADKARTEVDRLAGAHDTKPKNGAVAFRAGKAEADAPREGRTLDKDGAGKALRAAYPAPAGPVQLPVTTAKPAVGQAETDRALKDVARPAVSGPVTLTAADREIRIGQQALGRHLAMRADDKGRLSLRLDADALLKDPEVAPLVARATGGPVNAKLRLDGDKVVVTEDGRAGHTLTADSLRKAVLPLLSRTGDRRATVATQNVAPELTRKSVEQLGIKERMSSFTVNFEPAPYRTTNIGRAAELINGSVVLPDRTWSFNGTVGERTKENGFVDGTMILDGSYTKAPGGGVSAVATTMFNAIFFAGVKPVEHGAHSFYIERYPEGREATVAWGSLDLKFLNDSGHGIYILASATDHSITITFLGTRAYDEVTAEKGPRTNVTQPKDRTSDDPGCEPQPPLEGFDVTVDRVLHNDGKEVGRETFRTHYTPRDKVTCEQ